MTILFVILNYKYKESNIEYYNKNLVYNIFYIVNSFLIHKILEILYLYFFQLIHNLLLFLFFLLRKKNSIYSFLHQYF